MNDHVIPNKWVLQNIHRFIFYMLFNFGLCFLLGYLTIDVFANVNSRFASVICFSLIAYIIRLKTKEWSGKERVLKFGLGFIIYGFIASVKIGFLDPFLMYSMFIPCILFFLVLMILNTDLL